MMTQKIQAVLISLIVTAFASIAFAGTPLEMGKFEDSGGPFYDPVASANCGFDVLYEFREKGNWTAFDDGTFRQHFSSTIVFSNAATGAEIIETATWNLRSPPTLEIVDEVEETVTLIIFDTYAGVPFKWYQPGTGVLLRDAGRITFQITVVFDLDGNFISFSQEITGMNGPHPSLFISNDDYLALGCGAIS